MAEIMVTLRNMTEQKFLDENSSNEIKLIVQKFSFVQKFFEKFEKIVQMLDFMKKDNSIRYEHNQMILYILISDFAVYMKDLSNLTWYLFIDAKCNFFLMNIHFIIMKIGFLIIELT